MATDRATDATGAAPLAGRHVLVTRPAERADALCARLATDGATVHHAPLIAIEPLPATAAQRALAQDLDRFDVVIVTSRNAVQHGLPLLASFWPQWPVGQRWLAVGAATAAALAVHGIAAQAPADARSEGLLALPVLTAIAGRRVLLLTGEGGRGLLEETLAGRGAQVARLAVYRRVPTPGPVAAIDAFRDTLPAAVAAGARAALVTSSEALQNLLGLAPWLPASDVLLVVASARIARQARAAGIAHVRDANGADDAHMLDALHAWAADDNEEHA